MPCRQLLTIKQVAKYLQLDETTIYSYAQKAKIPAIKVGYNWRFKREDIDDWLENKKPYNKKNKV
ncbi:MAG: helix-turn-helix domain-containing protein [Elusimicrobia bacterium]|nr:helix-turn-helix domain-containing protein [Elusimicrobiota bacterium]